ncbi:MAG: Holliday junction branch migration protein RuvA [Planctomycetes bacterium]|nr:Holliday junction branch migration protein RuvA [Planctomycetota bacterium]
MFDFLEGRIARRGPTVIVLDVGGVGYELSCPLSSTEALTGLSKARLWVWLHVREDIFKLYGFATEDERSLFSLLQKVNGIGPTLAVALLSRARVPDLATAIDEGRTDFLKSLKGVGPKTAQRLITELKDRMGGFATGTAAGPDSAPTGSVASDAVAALEVLGCAEKSARDAVRKVLTNDPKAPLDTVVRLALRHIWPA